MDPSASPTAPQPPTDQAAPNVRNPLSVMQPGERVIFQVKRHPIGMLGTYVMSGILIIIVAVLAFVAAPAVLTNDSRNHVIGIGAIIVVIVALLCFGFVLIANKVYWGNSWILTSDSITQVIQRSLFDKQSSQLSLGNLEDVTAQQDGILAHMFNYGVLRVETAGERSKFIFPYCPNPTYYAQQVLEARELFEQGRRDNNPQRLYRDQTAYQQPPDQAPPVTPPPSESGVDLNTE